MIERARPIARAVQPSNPLRAVHPSAIRVVLADDHNVLRQALRVLLEMHEGIEVVADVSDGREAVEAALQYQPDVVLMDLAMPNLNGFEATTQIVRNSPRTKVIVLTGIADDDRVTAAVRAGASGYVLKRSDVSELLLAIQVVNLGNTFFSSAIPGRPVDYMLQAQRNEPSDGLTAREREVLQLVAEGYTNQEIADQLVLSVKTVEAHKSHIMAKVRATNRAELIKYAIRKGLTTLGDDPTLRSEGGRV